LPSKSIPRSLDPATHEALAERLRFYRDLGLTDFYRRDVAPFSAVDDPKPGRSVAEELAEREALLRAAIADAAQSATEPAAPQENFFREDPTIKSRKTIQVPEIGAVVPAENRAAALQAIRDDIGDCTRCALHKGRHSIVFADGSPSARLMFVGEGPGADEDAQGLPFVGRAGQLLNNMISAMGLKREECYIANVVKCRPPNNRNPAAEEIAACRPYLEEQIALIEPAVVVTLGNFATQLLMETTDGIGTVRGSVYPYGAGHLVPTYHPAYVLRAGGEAMAEMRADLVRAKRLLTQPA
jgi:DNA polymerase